MTRTRLLTVAVISLLGAGLVAGCGGGDGGGDEDPQEVLDATFSNDQSVNSGVIDLSISGSAEGEQGGSIDASLNGLPGQRRGAGRVPAVQSHGDSQRRGRWPEHRVRGRADRDHRPGLRQLPGHHLRGPEALLRSAQAGGRAGPGPGRPAGGPERRRDLRPARHRPVDVADEPRERGRRGGRGHRHDPHPR